MHYSELLKVWSRPLWGNVLNCAIWKKLLGVIRTLIFTDSAAETELCAVCKMCARWGFFFKFGAQICEVILNLHIKHQTAPHQTGSLWSWPNGAQQWPALSNCHRRSPLFWDMTQHRVVIPSGKHTVPSSRVKKSKTQNRAWMKLTDTILFFRTLFITQCFKDTWHFRSWICFNLYTKKHLFWWTPQIENYLQSLGTTETVTC